MGDEEEVVRKGLISLNGDGEGDEEEEEELVI